MSCQLPAGKTRNYKSNPCLPGNVAEGCVATLRFTIQVDAGGNAVQEIERPAGAEMSELQDIVASLIEVDPATGVGFIEVTAIEDDEGRNYFPKVGSDSVPGGGAALAGELGQDVPVNSTEFSREVYGGFGSGVSDTPFAKMTLPVLHDRTDKVRILFRNLDPAAPHTIAGEYKFNIIKGSKKNAASPAG